MAEWCAECAECVEDGGGWEAAGWCVEAAEWCVETADLQHLVCIAVLLELRLQAGVLEAKAV